jgi:hypothetical protein
MDARTLLPLALVAAVCALSSASSHAENGWGALVACCYGTPTKGTACGEGNVSTGFGSGTSQNEAIANATRNAMSDTDQSAAWKCTTVRSFNKGCGYIAEGCSEATKQCGWAIGATQQEALTKLKHEGYAGGDNPARGGACIGR